MVPLKIAASMPGTPGTMMNENGRRMGGIPQSTIRIPHELYCQKNALMIPHEVASTSQGNFRASMEIIVGQREKN
jgi:hypothetical protein